MGAFAGATRSGAALCAVQVFSRRENLDAGRIQFARADEGAGAPGGPWPAGASAGTQAEDALTMKRLYQAACGCRRAVRVSAIYVRELYRLHVIEGKVLP